MENISENLGIEKPKNPRKEPFVPKYELKKFNAPREPVEELVCVKCGKKIEKGKGHYSLPDGVRCIECRGKENPGSRKM